MTLVQALERLHHIAAFLNEDDYAEEIEELRDYIDTCLSYD